MELLLKQNETYANSASGRELLAKDSPRYLGHIIRHHHHLLESWSKLDQAVISGRPQRDRSSYSQEQWRESFLMGMFNLAMGLAPRIVPVIDVSDRQHLLDLGGGPGTYAIHLNNSMDGPLFPALFSLNMLLGTESGQSYSEAQITDMLAGAGASDIRRIPIESPNHSGILVGFV
jgi:hypothetical protein